MLALAFMPLPGVSQAASRTNVLDEVEALLKEHGVAYDTNALYEAAALGALRSIDAGARFLSSNEVARMAGGPGVMIAGQGAVLPDAVARDETWELGIRYLRLNGIFTDTGGIVTNALAQKTNDAGHGLIFDLRGAGGNDPAAVAIAAGAFVSESTNLFRVENMRGGVLQAYACSNGFRVEQPVIVLIDSGTRQAAEMLAAVLYRQPGIVLLGSRSAGDAFLRETIRLGPAGYVYIATRRMVPGDDLEFAWSGVTPHIEMDGGAVVSDLPAMPAPDSIRAPQPVVMIDVDPEAVSEDPEPEDLDSERVRQQQRLMNRVSLDATLGRAVNILIGLQALGEDERDATDDLNR